jgi:L-cystine uptake protein TcyP (sodium:dicarboxylate symporter family)
MSPTLHILVNLMIAAGFVLGLVWMKRKHYSFTARVLTALVIGIIYGGILQLSYGPSSDIVRNVNSWFGLLGTGYIRLLKMIVIPLIFVSITCSIINQKSQNLRKATGIIIAVLVITAGIAAGVGVATARILNLNAKGIEAGEKEIAQEKKLEVNLKDYQSKPIQDQLLEIIPTNPFYSLTGQGSNATLSVVFFAALIGVATIAVRKKKPERTVPFINGLNSLHDIIMRLVTMILRFTPYGIIALMTKMVSTTNFLEIWGLLRFVLGSYAAIIIMFIIHMVILSLFGMNPFTYVRKSIPTLTFAFTSRTSAGTLPMTIETQKDKLGVPEGIANLSSSLGTCIGQNGCAGIYPAMLAVMIAPAVGVPMDIVFIIKLIIVTAVGSFGIAGVGGGATFAALTVLSIMGLPIGLVGLLIAIEPLIDMARTALNVSDSMLSGLVTGRVLKEIDMSVYNNRAAVVLTNSSQP